MRIGILHPGEMGVSVAQALAASGHEVCWCRQGRSPATAQRAEAFTACATLNQLLSAVEAVISVCPPDAALQQARAVKAAGFAGVYVDANAVAPATAERIAALIGAGYVDGGIIGPPAHAPGTTRLYLSGSYAQQAADWFGAGHLATVVLPGSLTGASALKMAYAAFTKGSSALLLAVNALAEANGVLDALAAEWDISQPGLSARSKATAAGTSRKAWRFAGEMREIAATFEAAGLPPGFHLAAADLYQRLAPFKELPPAELQNVLQQLLKET